MKKSKILVIFMILTVLFTGLIYKLISEVSASSTNNTLLDSMEYLGVNIYWLRSNNLLNTYASTAGAFKNAGGAGGTVPGKSLTYPENVSIYIPYARSGNFGLTTKSDGTPDVEAFKSDGWTCTSFPTYYYLNYLPNVKNINISQTIIDKLTDKVGTSDVYYYQTVLNWRRAMESLAYYYPNLVQRYSLIDYTSSSENVSHEPNLEDRDGDSDTNDYYIRGTNTSLYDVITPGTVCICENTETGEENAHVALYAGYDGTYGYMADMSYGEDATKEGTGQEGHLGFSSFNYSEKGKPHTWYVFVNEEPEIETKDVKVTKVWNNDDNDAYGNRTPVTVTLKNKSTGQNVTQNANGNSITNPVTLNDSNNWTYTFKGLDATINYSIEEVSVPGYTSQITETSEGFTITNTMQTTSIKVTKEWVDLSNRDGKRPTTLTITLYEQQGNKLVESRDNNGNIRTITLRGSSNTWTGSFTNLPTHRDGELINYIVKEDEETVTSLGYQVKYENNGTNNVTIINSIESDVVNVTIKKVWEDEGNRENLRPNSVIVKFNEKFNDQIPSDATILRVWIRNGDGTNGNDWTDITAWVDESGTSVDAEPVELNNSNNWTFTTGELYKYWSGGVLKEFKVEEENVPDGYTAEYNSNTNTYTYTVTNRNEPEMLEIPVTKVWNDDNNKDGLRPSSITVKLLANGADTGKSLTLNASNGWKGTFTGLYQYEDGKEITYTIKEVSVNEYQTRITGSASTGFTITNTHTPATTQIKIIKKWEDDDNRDGKRPQTVQLRLLANGVQQRTITLSAANNWTQTITGLDKYANGDVINYSITESTVNGYNVSIQKTQTSDELITFTVTNTHTPEKIEIPITKIWDDDSNRDGKRPTSITVRLKSDDPSQSQPVQTATITGTGDTWTYTFKSTEREPIYKYRHNGVLINYTIEEVSIDGYETPVIQGNQTSGFTITNKYTPERVNITVIKNWDDDLNGKSNFDEYRPNELEITLYATVNGEKVKVTTARHLNTEYSNKAITNSTKITGTGDQWTYTFENLYRYENGEEIKYSVEEKIDHIKTAVNGNEAYTVSYEEPRITAASGNNPAKITLVINNEHEPKYEGYIEIRGTVWYDGQAGKANDIDGSLNDSDIDGLKNDKGISGIKVILRDASGAYFNGDETSSTAITGDNGEYVIKVNVDTTQNVYMLNQSPEDLNKRLAGAYVEFEYDANTYTTVQNASDANEKSSYNKSKAIENSTTRTTFDTTYSTVVEDGKNIEQWLKDCKGYKITATTKGIVSFAEYQDISDDQNDKTRTVTLKYGNGTSYIRTNPDGAWNNPLSGTIAELKGKNGIIETHDVDVTVYQNINLGLFRREQPNVTIFEELSKVEVIMNNQSYTYLYGMKDTSVNDSYSQLKVKFQNKGTYTYRRPINPADIAYVENVDENAMSVYVTYVVKAANISTTLKVNVDSIINVYDSQYTLESIKKGASDVYYENSNNYGLVDGAKEITLKNLQISLEPEKEADEVNTIVITYRVNNDAIIGLLNEEATLNNGVEIHAYSTSYGIDTMYAEQRTLRTDTGKDRDLYGGYDQDSTPRNAGIFYDSTMDLLRSEQAKKDYIAINGSEISSIADIGEENKYLEGDTDFAPSFVLCQSTPKTLAGTIWEDTDDNTDDKERLGNGKDDDGEVKVDNVKIQLYNLNGTIATLYDTSGNGTPAVTYSKDGGKYAFVGVVTGEYFVKYTYGDDEEDLKITEITPNIPVGATTMDGDTKVNARNYKSTIITDATIKNILQKDYTDFSENEKKWHITHDDGCSIAVDNMLDRLSITDLVYENFKTTDIENVSVEIAPENMTAYSKPFKTQVEFEASGESDVKVDGEGNSDGTIVKVADSSKLDKLDFGIIERPRENLSIQKTATYVKVTLANGQVLTEGDPRTGKLNYVKYMDPNVSGKQINNYDAKELLIEMDEELIQGAQLEVKFDVKVTNSNEIDYDYEANYTDIDLDNHKYITKIDDADYYYYGVNTLNKNPLAAKVKFMDYMNKGLVYDKDEVEAEWDILQPDDINGRVHEQIPIDLRNEEYNVFELKKGEGDNPVEVVIEQGKTTEPIEMTATKLLTVREENSYDVSAEIYSIDAKTARTIKESEEGTGRQKLKTYQPGNYNPAYNMVNQQDDDRIDITVTPPTGIGEYIKNYATVGLGGLVAIAIVIIFIKKKVLTK